MNTGHYDCSSSAKNAMPDQVEFLYKTNFNNAWGNTVKSYRNGREWIGLQIDNAHRRAIAEVQKQYTKSGTGEWIKKLQETSA